MRISKHEKKLEFNQLPSLMLNFFFEFNIIFFFVLNVSNAQEFESDLILVKDNISVGNFIEAELVLNKILKKDPSYAPAHVLFSKIWLLTAEMKKASESANLAVRIDEDFRPWWDELNDIRKKIQVGISKMKKQDYVFAEEVFSDLINRYPAYPEMHYYLGLAKYKQEHYSEALGNFSKALDLFPDYLNAQKALINVKKRIKK